MQHQPGASFILGWWFVCEPKAVDGIKTGLGMLRDVFFNNTMMQAVAVIDTPLGVTQFVAAYVVENRARSERSDFLLS